MKLYTRGGDDGSTGLFGGDRVPKAHPRLAAYGGLDELNALVGLLRLHVGRGTAADPVGDELGDPETGPPADDVVPAAPAPAPVQAAVATSTPVSSSPNTPRRPVRSAWEIPAFVTAGSLLWSLTGGRRTPAAHDGRVPPAGQ